MRHSDKIIPADDKLKFQTDGMVFWTVGRQNGRQICNEGGTAVCPEVPTDLFLWLL